MVFLSILLSILALAVIVYFTGQYAKTNLAKKFPPPGKMVGSTQHRLHVNCQGQGPVTVLLEAGLNKFSVHWHRVQTLLVQHTKTCAYDRAGLDGVRLTKIQAPCKIWWMIYNWLFNL